VLICVDDSGFDADVSFNSDLKTMAELWVGEISGMMWLTRNISKWLVFSAFAGIKSELS